jgi:hypothetical protein
MKNKWFWCSAVVLAFVLVGCPNGTTNNGTTGDKTKLEGTWVGTSDIALICEVQFIFSGNDFLQKQGDEDLFKGTFIFSETEIQLTVTHVWLFEKWRVHPSPPYPVQYKFLDDDTLEILSVNQSEADASIGIYERQ